TTNLLVTVTAPANGTSLTNSATGGSPLLDPNPTNNTPPPVVTTVLSSADVQAAKIGPATVMASMGFNYTISVSNAGPSIATSLPVTDSLPVGVTFVSASAGGVLSSGQVVWPNLGNLAAGSSTNLTITVTAPANGASLTNVASVGGFVSDPNPGNNTTPPVVT